jgi:hypothetical protein
MVNDTLKSDAPVAVTSRLRLVGAVDPITMDAQFRRMGQHRDWTVRDDDAVGLGERRDRRNEADRTMTSPSTRSRVGPANPPMISVAFSGYKGARSWAGATKRCWAAFGRNYREMSLAGEKWQAQARSGTGRAWRSSW